METPNVRSEVNASEPAETVLEPPETVPELSTVQAEIAAGGVTIADTGTTVVEAKPSYVKLAMRNMVRKRGLSLQHFALTTIGLLAFLIGLSYLTR